MEVVCRQKPQLLTILSILLTTCNLYCQGVYNLNSVMGFSRQPASQNIEPGWEENDPQLVETIEKNGNRGDFIMTMGRNLEDETQLAQTFAKHLNGQNVHHLKVSC